ncbi:MAG: hypothetical protein Kow0069_28480 [Promethearchaeota archaeon]
MPNAKKQEAKRSSPGSKGKVPQGGEGESAEEVDWEDELEDIVADSGRDVILDMYEEDLECDMDCSTCKPIERAECVRELKQATLVVIQKLNALYRDFNEFSKKIFRMLKIAKYLERFEEAAGAATREAGDPGSSAATSFFT